MIGLLEANDGFAKIFERFRRNFCVAAIQGKLQGIEANFVLFALAKRRKLCDRLCGQHSVIIWNVIESNAPQYSSKCQIAVLSSRRLLALMALEL